MAVVKPEVVIIQALYEIDMKFQRLNHHFQDGLHDHACGRFHQITVTLEIQDGAYETGNSYNSGAVSDRYAVPTAKTFVSTTAIKTLHAAIVSYAQLHRKSDMAAVKPEVVIIWSYVIHNSSIDKASQISNICPAKKYLAYEHQ
jgi:hypothetical protein